MTQPSKGLLSLLLLCLALLPVHGQKKVVDEVIWVVGDEAILLSDVEETRISAQLHGTPFENPYCTIPEQLAIQKLFLHQADLDSIYATEADIISSVDEEINYYLQNLGSRENVERWSGKTISELREQLKRSQRDSYRMRMMQQKITANVKATPAEVRAYYQDMPEDSLPFIPTQVEVQIITYQPQPSNEEVERITSTLQGYAERVTNGESDFSTLAMLYSADASARVGGELGYMGKNQLVPEFAGAAFSLSNPGELSPVVQTEYGYHIIQLIDNNGERVNCRHILLRPDIDDKEIAFGLGRLDSIGEDIRNKEFSFDEAAAVLSDDKETRNNKGLMVNKNSEEGSLTSRFEMKDLNQDIAAVVEGMSVGEVSHSFTYTNDNGQINCAIILLKNRIEGHRASITEDFQILREAVVAKRREETLRKWIEEKQMATYVRINPQWRNCDFEFPNWVK